MENFESLYANIMEANGSRYDKLKSKRGSHNKHHNKEEKKVTSSASRNSGKKEIRDSLKESYEDAEEIRRAANLYAKEIGISLDRFTKEFGRRMYIAGAKSGKSADSGSMHGIRGDISPEYSGRSPLSQAYEDKFGGTGARFSDAKNPLLRK